MLTVTPSKLLTDRTSYQAWPVIVAASSGALVVAYSSGAAVHPVEDDARGVYVIRSLDHGMTWDQPILVVNSVTSDESTYGVGLNAAGDILLWVRTVTAGAFDNVLYRSLDEGLSWSLFSTPSFSAMPILVGPIVAVAGTLLAPYHAGPESGPAVRTWGHLRSLDDGETWTQVELGTAASDDLWPVEPRYYVAEDGYRILAVTRNKVTDAALWQYTSSNSGVDWTTATPTNITDGNNTPVALVGSDDELLAIYFDRGAGVMRVRSTTLGDIFGSATLWPESVVIAHGTTYFADNGYPHAVRTQGGTLCVWYSGMYRYPGIMAFGIQSDVASLPEPGIFAAPRPTRILDRISANPAGILTPVAGDISWQVPVTATSPTLVSYGLVPLIDEVWAEGKLFWRLLAAGSVGNVADTLTASAHYYRDSGARVDPAQPTLTFTAVTNTVKDSGWIPLPIDFGKVAATHLHLRYRVDIRVRVNAGALAAGRVYANTTLLFGVS